MNEVYFFCDRCRAYLRAGHRHALLALSSCGIIEPDILGREETFVRIDAARVLGCEAYLLKGNNVSETANRVTRARRFLEEHAGHEISFGDIHRITNARESWYEWLCEDGDEELMPRYFVERLHLTGWPEIKSYVSAGARRPWWWGDEQSQTMAEARAKVQGLLAG